MSNSKQAPPLYVWLLLAAFFVVGQWALFLYPEHVSSQQEGLLDESLSLQARRSISQLEVIKPHYINQTIRHPNAYHVVVIGSSISNNSIACTDVLLEESKALLGEEIIVTKFFSPGRPIKAFIVEGNLTELLVAHKPDLVLIEDEIVIYSFRRYGSKSRTRRRRFRQITKGGGPLAYLEAARIWGIRVLQQNRLNMMATIQNQRLKTAPPFTSEPCGDMIVSPQLGDTTQITTRKRFIIPFDKQDYTHDFIRSLQQEDIDIALLHHPRAVQLEAMYQAIPESDTLRKNAELFQQTFGIPHWQCPLKFPYLYYRDQAHMNHIGREKYDRWLLNKIYQHKKES